MSPRTVTHARASALRLVRSGAGTESDDDTLRRARSGNQAALRALYDANVQSVMALGLAILRNRADAEDVLQETFAVAFAKLDDVREPARFRSWLTAITVRRARRKRRRVQLLGLLGLGREDELTLEDLAGPSTPEEARSELRAIDVVLGTVPEAHRVAWLLRHVEGEALESVAAACECSLATVKRWLASTDHELTRALAAEAPPRRSTR